MPEPVQQTDVHLPSTPSDVLWGRLPSRADAPARTVRPGTVVSIDTVSHEGILPDQGSDPTAFFARHGVDRRDVLDDAVDIARTLTRAETDGPHVVSRPVAVAGAEPGDVVSVTVLATDRRVPYGVISNRHGRGALPGELPRAEESVSVFADVVTRDGVDLGRLPAVEGGPRVVTFPLRPFPGILGVVPDTDERPHSVPPGPYGGNLDINLLTAGSTLHLPVFVPGAGVYVGDPHFAQGDGEVALTAMEASLRLTLRLDLVPRATALRRFGELVGPLAETTEYLVPTGLDPDLDEAVRRCVRAAITLLGARWGVEEHLAYAYCSAATDFRISQVVDLVCGSHATIRKADFAALDTGADATGAVALGGGA